MTDSIYELLNTPAFGLTISFAVYSMSERINSRVNSVIANPLLIASTIIILILLIAGIDYDVYYEGGRFIDYLLGPATVCLAVPLYRNLKYIKRNLIAIIGSITVGAIASVLFVVLMAMLTGAKMDIIISVAPKSATTPIAVEITRLLEGIPSLTVVFVILSGIVGAIIGPEFCNKINIKDKIAKGLAIGSASHGIGTSRAIKEDETVGAMSSLAIGLMGIATAVAVPIIIRVLYMFI